jgi:4-hydroxy-tetrahydrodipicolinate synthase
MDERGRIDYPALRGLVDFHLGRGTDALVIAGTTGEGATLSATETGDLVGAVVRQVDGRIPVIAGCGCADTAKTIALAEQAERRGADAALVVTPYYNRPMQSGLEAHFSAVANATGIPLILYNVPSRTAVDLMPETVARLARREDIVAIKEAKPDLDRISELVELCGEHFTVLSGDDGSCMGAMLRGAAGVVSVAANVVPRRMHDLCTAASRGDRDAAAAIDAGLRELFGALSIESNPIPVKWSVARMGLIGEGLRLPLLPLSEGCRHEVEKCLVALGVLDETIREHEFEDA